MQDEQRNESQFDLIRFVSNSLRFLRRTFWLVLLAALIGALAMAFYTRKTYSPRYECHAVLSVRVDNSTVTDVIGGGDKTNSAYTKQLVTTFPTIIQSDSMRDRIMRELGTSSINGTIIPRVIADSSLFTLTVRSSSPKDAYNILNAVIKCYPDMAFIYIGAASITLIEAPVMPTAPVKALSLGRPAAIGALAGGLLLLAILCLLAQLQTVVTSSADLKKYTSVPCIVHVPQTELKRRASGGNRLSLRNEHLPPVYEEAIRVLGARVMRFCREQSLRRILVTSTVPGEGKSTIAANLAMTLGRSGLRVVLIDADLRTQELRAFFGVEGEPRGLKDLLQDPNMDAASCLTPIGDTGVQLLCGDRVDRPVSLLRRGRLSALLEQLDAVADVVLIDTPPIGLLTDAAAFAQHCDAAIFVVRAGATAGNRIADSMQAVADCRTKILGYVLNGVSTKSSSGGYGYRYSYGYGSSYGSSYGRSSYRSSGYSHYGNYGNYGDYGHYGSYGSYGGYADYREDSASDKQKKAEKSRRHRKSTEKTESKSRRRTETPAESPAAEALKATETPTPAPEKPRHAERSRSGRREESTPVRETPKVTEEPAPVRETPKVTEEPAPVRETPKVPEENPAPVRETPKVTEEPAPVREAPKVTEEPAPVRETPKPAGEPGPSEIPMEAAKAAPVPEKKDAAYDDPELEAIVREVLANTTEEDVRRAYETLEAETVHRHGRPRQDVIGPARTKKGGLFHRGSDK